MAYYLYLIFIISYFLHLTMRVPVLGAVRFDLILAGIIMGATLLRGPRPKQAGVGHTGLILTLLAVYIVVSLPFVRWPGSVLGSGIPNFLKAAVFYAFTVALIDTRKRLRGFIVVFVLCQLFRVLEPYYLHVTQGYWGSRTTMAEGETLNRLAGSPHDVINPNGLAFVITSILPFLHYLSFTSSIAFRLLYWGSLPILLQALILTASRTGFLAFGAVLVGVFLKSRRKLLLSTIAIAAVAFAYGTLGDLQRDRVASIWNPEVRGAQTARGRLEGVARNFQVGMQRPVFGHGLGTSLEANANAVQVAQPAHNLYAEVFEELGGIGLVLFLVFIIAIVVNFRRARQLLRSMSGPDPFLVQVVNAMETWLLMNLMFSFASYGLSSYEWYLFAGLSVVVRRLAHAFAAAPAMPRTAEAPAAVKGPGLAPASPNRSV